MNPNSILYVFVSWFLSLCYGFVLLSSAAGQLSDLNLFEAGNSFTYKLQSEVLLNEKDNCSKNVGFYVDGDVKINSLWSQGKDKILQIELIKPLLHIKSRKAPSPDGFVPHKSNLDKIQNKPYLVIFKNNQIDRIMIPKNEPLSLVNIKKGFASLLQFQMYEGETTEIDSSGECRAKYTAIADDKFTKTKTNCISKDLPYVYNPKEILKTIVESSRTSEYHLDLQKNIIKSIKMKENHKMFLSAKEDIGNFVEADQTLNLVNEANIKTIDGQNVEEAVEKFIKKESVIYTQESLLTDREYENEEMLFSNTVQELKDNLKSENIGTLKSARSFIKLINIGRKSRKNDIQKALTSKKNKDILSQLYDILGFIQTQDAHEAVMKNLLFDNENMLDLSERYLWALSICSKPNPDIIMDLLKRYQKNNNIPEKVKETMILSIASMTYRLNQLKNPDKRVSNNVEEAILNNLDYAKSEEKHPFFRALKNLKSPKTIPKLLEIISKGTPKEGVLSWKIIKTLPKESWDDNVIKSAKKTFLQLDKRHDSSSRTIAAELLLETNISKENLKDFLHYLHSNDTAYEVKQYLYQNIRMKSDECPKFKQMVLNIIKNDPLLNNWFTLAPRGMSTALSRSFLTSSSSNGSLVSLQELKSGIVKRGSFNIVMKKNGAINEIFSLGLFSGGLSSFMSSNSNSESEVEDDESANAGMELSVLGTQLRPFVFFNGQGELMGHVWSGTASEETPAYQANTLLQDHLEYIRLGNGLIAELDVKGALSFDLSGSIKISIYYSTAESLVEKAAGIAVIGTTKIDTSFVKSLVEFSASIEPKLSLNSDLNFSGKPRACMRLTQPDSLLTHNIYKIERIPDSKHKLRIAKYKKTHIPGVTYSLNRKNNEMCSVLFQYA